MRVASPHRMLKCVVVSGSRETPSVVVSGSRETPSVVVSGSRETPFVVGFGSRETPSVVGFGSRETSSVVGFGSRETPFRWFRVKRNPFPLLVPGQEKPLSSLVSGQEKPLSSFICVWAKRNPRGVRFRLLLESSYVVICSVVWRLSRGSDSQCPKSVFAFTKGALRMSPSVRIRIP